VRRAAAAVVVLAVAAAVFALTAPSAGPPPSGPAVVDVLLEPRSGPATVATGFHTGDGRVVTVAHLLPGRSAQVLVRSDGGRTVRARILSVDRRADLALLAVRPAVRRPSPLPGPGSPHLLVRRDGHSAALPVKIRRRIDARIRPRPGAAPVRRAALELDARVRQGDSGAPLVAADGTTLGMLFAQSSGRDETAYAVALSR
jgi:S1-C subfamily serine protease